MISLISIAEKKLINNKKIKKIIKSKIYNNSNKINIELKKLFPLLRKKLSFKQKNGEFVFILRFYF